MSSVKTKKLLYLKDFNHGLQNEMFICYSYTVSIKYYVFNNMKFDCFAVYFILSYFFMVWGAGREKIIYQCINANAYLAIGGFKYI